MFCLGVVPFPLVVEDAWAYVECALFEHPRVCIATCSVSTSLQQAIYQQVPQTPFATACMGAAGKSQQPYTLPSAIGAPHASRCYTYLMY